MTPEEEQAVLAMSEQQDRAFDERIALQREQGQADKWKKISDSEDLKALASLKEAIDQKHQKLNRRRGRPARTVPLEGIYMKWPKPLLDELRDQARSLHIPYQHFIRMLVSERMAQRKKEE